MELLVVLFLTLFFSILNMIQVFLGALSTPKNALFIGITHWYEDFFYYLSHLTQGSSGLWQTQNWYTTETLPSNPGWWTNIMLGKLGALLSLDPWVTYRSALFLLSVLLILTIYRVCKKIFPDNQLLRLGCFLLTLTGTSFFHIQSFLQGLGIVPYTFFFSATLALNRIGGTVHQLTANILSLVLILVLARLIDEIRKGKKIRNRIPTLLLVPILSYLLTMLQPIAGVMISASVGLVLFVLSVQRNGKTHALSYGLIELLLIIPALPVCLLFLNLSRHPFYAYTLSVYEGSIPPAPISTLLLSLGAITLCIPFGILSFFKKKTGIFWIGGVYGFLPFLLYLSPLPKFIGIQYSRILQPESHIFLSAVAVLGLWNIARWLSNRVPTLRLPLLFSLFLTALLLLEMPTLIWEVQGRIQAGKDFRHLDTLSKPLYEGLTVLKTKPFGNTIAPYMESQFIPIGAGKPVYAGHRTMTIDYDRKMKEIADFFSQKWNSEKAEQFFREKNLRYVVLPAGKNGQEQFEHAYPFLSPFWSSEFLALYEGRQ